MICDSHGNGNGLNDLHILPETQSEHELIKQFAKDNGLMLSRSFGNVEGHIWYGKTFYEIPFGQGYMDQLLALAEKETAS